MVRNDGGRKARPYLVIEQGNVPRFLGYAVYEVGDLETDNVLDLLGHLGKAV
jgi:hypothetical protein